MEKMVNPLAKKTIDKAAADLNQALGGVGIIQQNDILQNMAKLLEMTTKKGAFTFTRDDVISTLGQTLNSLFMGAGDNGRVTGGMLKAANLLREISKIYSASADGKLTTHVPANLRIGEYLDEKRTPKYNLVFSDDVAKNKFKIVNKDESHMDALVDTIRKKGYLTPRQLRVLANLLPNEK
jgi:hypothetical protein